ncbi:MAG: ATP-binding protein [Thermoleophilia bacterium]
MSEAASTGGTPAREVPWLERIGVGPLLAVSVGVLFALAALGTVLALVANEQLDGRRTTLVDVVDPALTSSLALESALLNQETAIRGFALARDPRFLEPYRTGRAAEESAAAELESAGGAFGAELAAVRRDAAAWRDGYAARVVAAGADGALPGPAAGKARFDRLRASLDALQARLTRDRAEARSDLLAAADRLRLALIATIVLIVAGLIGAGIVLHRFITRPLVTLSREADRVASGEFGKRLELVTGPREIATVNRSVETMREHIVAELTAAREARALLQEQTDELGRSNADLEQFAYVASHDLQEPLRKIVSFSQVLERRYRSQLDERADQYIDFIVDGGKRMQQLINDLLAFSRVGRKGAGQEPVALGDAVAQAQAQLSQAIADVGGEVRVGELPTVRGEAPLLVAVFQNLIANAIKFRGEDPPVVEITARDAGDEWELAVTDNGIGIDQEFAERIFVIFQRLHARDAYEGTGIGLALVRKIVEYHGGRIWLDPDHRGGSRFRITLPKPAEETDPEKEEEPWTRT